MACAIESHRPFVSGPRVFEGVVPRIQLAQKHRKAYLFSDDVPQFHIKETQRFNGSGSAVGTERGIEHAVGKQRVHCGGQTLVLDIGNHDTH